MELVLLGTSAAYPTVERACSGFLVRDGNTSILLEIGSGVVRNLMRWMDPRRLSAIMISHLHQDHFIDIFPLYYYLAFHDPINLPLDIYAPEGTRDIVVNLLQSEARLDEVYNFKTLVDREPFTIGDFMCMSIPVKHSKRASGVRVEGKRVLAYSSDTGFDEVLYELASGSDAFICEATKLEDYKDVLHLTAAQAGDIAEKSGAKKLILTHIWPDFDPLVQKQRAQEHYSGEIIVAEDNMRMLLD